MLAFSQQAYSAPVPQAPACGRSVMPAGASGRSWKLNEKSDDAPSRAGGRPLLLQAFAMKRKAAELCASSGVEALEKQGVRLSQCGLVPHGQAPVNLMKAPDGGAYMTGTKRCNSVWACPRCSARISAARRSDMNELLHRARGRGFSPVLLTLTARHGRADELAALLPAMKAAKRRLVQLAGWRRFKAALAGTVTATELTHGGNGWHVHFHMILICKADPAAALAAVESLRPLWLRALRSAGLSGNHAAFRADPGHLAGEYVSKWGAAEELTLATVKAGRSGSRSPWQLLRDAAEGDGRAGALWLQFVRDFKGVRQLVWSRGLREAFGLDDELPDDEVPEAGATAEAVILRSWWRCPAEGWARWKLARRRLVSLLEAAAAGGCLDAAEAGPTDAERWRAYLLASAVLE